MSLTLWILSLKSDSPVTEDETAGFGECHQALSPPVTPTAGPEFPQLVKQGWDALWAIGPLDALTSLIIGKGVAQNAAREKYPAPPQERYDNAFRHCYGSCLAYQYIGEDALTAMEIHEKYGIHPTMRECDEATDRFNNAVAVELAIENPDGSCYDMCSEAIETNGLMIKPGFSDSAKDVGVEAICQF